MKTRNNISSYIPGLAVCILIACCLNIGNAMAQDKKKSPVAKKDTISKKTTATADTTAAEPAVKKKSFVKNTFDGNYIIDNQTVMVPIKGTFEFDIQHRFGTVDNGFRDLFGIFFGANIMFSFNYV